MPVQRRPALKGRAGRSPQRLVRTTENTAPSGSATVAIRPCGVSWAGLRTCPPRSRRWASGRVHVGDLEVRHPMGAPVAGEGVADAVDAGHRAPLDVQGDVVEVGGDDRLLLEAEDVS